MRTSLCVAAWLLAAAGTATANDAIDRGKALFLSGTEPSCGICHTLSDAGTAGAIGPNLNDLGPDAAAVKAAVSGGVGIMPAFADTLSADDIDALAAYVSAAASR